MTGITAVYHTLRNECGFTHYMVRVVAKQCMRDRRLMQICDNMGKKVVEENDAEVEQVALMCMKATPEQTIEALRRYIHSDRSEPPAMEWHLTKAVILRISQWQEWDAKTRNPILVGLRSVRVWEQRRALRLWSERNLHTYLVIKGLAVSQYIL